MRGGGAVAYTSKLPAAMSIGLGLDVWEIPHAELINDNEPALPPGEGGLDTPAVWRAFVEWAGELPPGTREFAVALPPAAVDAWRAIGADLPWSAPVVGGSDGAPVAHPEGTAGARVNRHHAQAPRSRSPCPARTPACWLYPDQCLNRD